MTKTFKEMTITEKLEFSAELVKALATEDAITLESQQQSVDEVVEFLMERKAMQEKSNSTPRKASTHSAGLQGAVLDLMAETKARMVADDVFDAIVATDYKDEHESGLTIARVRSALSTLAKNGMLQKFEAERKKDSVFKKVSYQIVE